MQEATWIASTRPSRMLNELKVRRPSEARKFRLVAVACCRRIWDLLDEPARRAVDGLERFADGRSNEGEMTALAREALIAAWAHTEVPWAMHAAEAAANAVAWEDDHQRRPEGPVINRIARVAGSAYHAAYARAAALHTGALEGGGRLAIRSEEAAESWQAAIQAEEATQAELVREVFGNVCRPIEFDPAWRSAGVAGLARAIEESGDFDGMPALGDALEEAGCARPEILDHCRSPGGHVRGCWVVDAVLGIRAG